MSELAERLAAALSDRYTIQREIGQGGMATVYLAQDLKHNRKVALKVLKPELAAVVGADRFLTEIEVTANLQHPNILPLFDSGEADGFLYYVMPFVEGETLRDWIDREHQLPVDEAVRIATEVAEALDHAHRQGVVHRDIKPGNILIRDGRPLVADFGIALAVGSAGGARLTETGLSVGTPFYMSPEQATGDSTVGAQSDVYALASVLYEMLVGEPPFPGTTAQAVLGKIIAGGRVSATERRASIPPNVDGALRRALEKIPADRFGSAAEFARALNDPAFRYGEQPGTTGEGVSPAWRAGALAAGLAALVLAGLVAARPGAPAPEVARYEMELGLEGGDSNTFGNHLAMSPDGRMIAYTGTGPGVEEVPGLWIRDLDNLEPRLIPGTEGAFHVDFSPDGLNIAFVTSDRRIKVVSLTGRPPLELTRDTTINRAGVSWGDDGYVYFSRRSEPYGISRILSSGGPVEVVTTVDEGRDEIRHYFPDVLPGSRRMIVTMARTTNYDADNREVGIADVETGEVTVLLQGIQGLWSTTGHLLAVLGDGSLVAAALDPGTGELGPQVPLFTGIGVDALVSADLAISEQGSLVYAPGAAVQRLPVEPVWVDRSGSVTPVDPNWRGASILGIRLSPDGSKVAYTDAETGAAGLYVAVKELPDGPVQRLTAQEAGVGHQRPAWTPGGEEVGYVRSDAGTLTPLVRRADAATPARTLFEGDQIQEVTFSPDGRWIVYRDEEDLYLLSTEEGAAPEPLLVDPTFVESSPAISPDSRWLAYVSAETGEPIVYVRPFPDVNSARTVISTGPAISPVWARDGSELYYRDGDTRTLIAAAVSTRDGQFSIMDRQALFSEIGYSFDARHTSYDVGPEGRFLMARTNDAAQRDRVIFVQNFAQELLERVAN